MPELTESVSQFWSSRRVGDVLIEAFGGRYRAAYLSVGFVKASGVRYIADQIAQFRERGGTVQAIIGVDGKVTTSTGVKALRSLINDLWLFRHPGRPLFHPKTYLFEGEPGGLAIVGSANLTESALWVNYEDAVVISFDLRVEADQSLFDELKRSFSDAIKSPNAERATDGLISALEAADLLPGEVKAARAAQAERAQANKQAKRQGLAGRFPPTATPPPPKTPLLPQEQADRASNPPPRISRRKGARAAVPGVPVPTRKTTSTVFVLRLGNRDVGVKRGYSPDVFIPVSAYRADVPFWGTFKTKGPGADPERFARFRFNRLTGATEVARRRLYFYRARDEFRLSSPQVHADAAVGDLMRIELAPPALGIDYVIEVLKPGHPQFLAHKAIAANAVPNSQKRWGYS